MDLERRTGTGGTAGDESSLVPQAWGRKRGNEEEQGANLGVGGMWKEINRHRTGRQNEGEIIDAYGEMKAERLRGVGGYLETKRRSGKKED